MDRATFHRLAEAAEIVPVTRHIRLPPRKGARLLPRQLRAAGVAFVLESEHAGWEKDGATLLGWSPRAVIRAWGDRVEWSEGGETTTLHGAAPLDLIFRHVGRRPVVPGLPCFSGGLVGYLGWGASRWFEPRVAARPDAKFPDAELMVVDDLCAIPPDGDVATLITNVEPARFGSAAAALAFAERRLDLLALGLEAGFDAGTTTEIALGEERDLWGPAGFESGVRKVLEHLRAGDCMQAVLSRRLVTSFSGNPLALYERLRDASPVPYHFFMRFEDDHGGPRAVMGASPELLVRVEGDHVTVRPIAGTRPRGATEPEDRQHELDLLADPKELAEHVMLVDLGRNDVGRVAAPGSVRVEQREVVERFARVMHLTSQVGGTLRPGLTPKDALVAAFPAGTVSGAPKVRAMEILEALEPVPRGPYGGAVGTVCYDGSIVMAIHLRSVALAGQELRLQAGAGIVSDSVPERELAETDAKLASVRDALSAGSLSGALRWRRW